MIHWTFISVITFSFKYEQMKDGLFRLTQLDNLYDFHLVFVVITLNHAQHLHLEN